MRCFHTTRYDLYNKNNIKIMIMSDIHFSKCVKDKKLNYITKYINKEQPNYILIPGDLIDSNNDIEVLNEKDRLINNNANRMSFGNSFFNNYRNNSNNMIQMPKKKSNYQKFWDVFLNL